MDSTTQWTAQLNGRHNTMDSMTQWTAPFNDTDSKCHKETEN